MPSSRCRPPRRGPTATSPSSRWCFARRAWSRRPPPPPSRDRPCARRPPMDKPTIALDTNHGTIVLELDADKAPKTVDNFLEYVAAGFYDGTLFHRVIPGFMIQGGGFDVH